MPTQKSIDSMVSADGSTVKMSTVPGNRIEYTADGVMPSTAYKNTLTFLYDADDTLSGFIGFDGKYNYYGRNSQGDITEIYGEDSTLLCRYVYDTWGKLVSVKDGGGVDKTSDESFIGNVNPFRYRGYYYNRETGLYYLNSRYYDPEVGRFINADALIDSGHELLGHNLFAYCNNNPANQSDPSGMAPGDAFKSAIKAAMDFGQNYNGVSIARDKEYASYIYSYKETVHFIIDWKVTRYSYTDPRVGESRNISVPPKSDLAGNKMEAIIHTHGAYKGKNSDNFSGWRSGDYGDVEVARDYGVPVYLVSPIGQLRKYDPSVRVWQNRDKLISSKMPYDPNHPKR